MTYSAFDLTGKVALVTGGNSGIGLGMAESLVAAGADICIWGTNEQKNAVASEQLKRFGQRVLALRCDVGDEDQVEKSFAETVKLLGKVDACFANAGIAGAAASFAEMTTEEWRRVVRVNLDGVFFTLRAAVRHMITRGQGGSLAATASLAAGQGRPRGENYAASKGAVISIMKSLAVELARYKIRANTIIPGWIVTPMGGDLFESKLFKEKVLPRIPVRRWGSPSDFGGIAVYLTSDASTYHTGDTFVIDGGYAIF